MLADLDGRIDAVLDGGPAQVGVESTIVACWSATPLASCVRAACRARRSSGVIGRDLEAGTESSQPLAPGMLASHYAPRARVRLNATEILAGEGALLFGGDRPDGTGRAARAVNLSPHGNLAEAAANLFAALRELDASGVGTIAVGPIPSHGLGEAINDRLQRAAADR